MHYSNKITAYGRYETPSIQKVYWIDGVHQLRYLNIIYNADINKIIDHIRYLSKELGNQYVLTRQLDPKFKIIETFEWKCLFNSLSSHSDPFTSTA